MRYTIRSRRIGVKDHRHSPSAETTALATYQVGGEIRVVTSTAEEELRVWDAYSGSIISGPFQARSDISRLSFHEDRQHALIAFEVNGRPRLATSINIDSVQVWDPETGRLAYPPLHPSNSLFRPWVNAIHVFEGTYGTMLASGCEDGRLHIHDAATGEQMGPPLRTGSAAIVALSSFRHRRGPELLISADADGVARVWEPDTAAQIGPPLHCAKGLTSILPFSLVDRGAGLAVAERHVERWDLATGQRLETWEAAWNAVLVDAPNTGPVALTLDSAGRATARRLSDGATLGTVTTEPGSQLHAVTPLVTPGRSRVAADLGDRIEIWDADRWRLEAVLWARRPGAEDAKTTVLSTAGLPDGKLALGLLEGWAVVEFQET